jgi:hypothetical protein
MALGKTWKSNRHFLLLCETRRKSNVSRILWKFRAIILQFVFHNENLQCLLHYAKFIIFRVTDLTIYFISFLGLFTLIHTNLPTRLITTRFHVLRRTSRRLHISSNVNISAFKSFQYPNYWQNKLWWRVISLYEYSVRFVGKVVTVNVIRHRGE